MRSLPRYFLIGVTLQLAVVVETLIGALPLVNIMMIGAWATVTLNGNLATAKPKVIINVSLFLRYTEASANQLRLNIIDGSW